MSTSQDVKDAADAVAVAKSALVTAQAAVDAKIAEAVALIPDEQAAVEAATQAYSTAFSAASDTVGYPAAAAALSAANQAVSFAVLTLSEVAEQYDGL